MAYISQIDFSTRCQTNSLIGHGCYFGRTIHALCNMHTLIMSGVEWLSKPQIETNFDTEFIPEFSYWLVVTHSIFLNDRQQCKLHVFKSLLILVPGLQDCLGYESMTEEEIQLIGDLISFFFTD